MPPKAAASKAKSGDASHLSYQDMIIGAITTLKERNGSSRVALKKYVKANNSISVSDTHFDSLFNKALRTGVDKGVFAQPKGSSGGTKLAKKEAKPAAAKKTEKKSVEKKPAVKKATTTKKPAAKPKTATKAKAAPKTAAKKTAAPKAKKPAAPKVKKASVPKAAPAVVDKPAVLGKTKSGRVTKTTPKTPATKKAAPKKAAPKKAAPKKAAA